MGKQRAEWEKMTPLEEYSQNSFNEYSELIPSLTISYEGETK